MWPDLSNATALHLLGDLTPEEVLDEMGAPMAWTARAPGGGLLLVSLCADSRGERLLRYLVASITARDVERLKRGGLTTREALTGGWLWLAERGYGGGWLRAGQVDPDDLPDGALPMPGTMLTYELEPVFTLRAVGSTIKTFAIVGGVISHTIDAGKRSLKGLIDFVFDDDVSPDIIGLCDLPVQHMAFNSFQVSFQGPEPSTQVGLFDGDDPREEKVWSLLSEGLSWVAEGARGANPGDSIDEQLAILEAIRLLAPPASGPIEEMYISGAELPNGHEPVRLDRSHGKAIRARLRELRKQRPEVMAHYIGTVKALANTLTFELKVVQLVFPERNDLPGTGRTLKCKATEDHRDDIKEAFDKGYTPAGGGTEVLYSVTGLIEPGRSKPLRVIQFEQHVPKTAPEEMNLPLGSPRSQ